MDDVFELFISSTRGAVPIRLPLTKRITTIGADDQSDIQLFTVPAHWAVLTRMAQSVRLLMTSTQSEHTLVIGESIEVDGVKLGIESRVIAQERELAVESLISELTTIVSPQRALTRILSGVMQASKADTGAVILTENDHYTIASALDAEGKPLQNAEELLSDTIVRDVLGSGTQICLSNVADYGRYAHIPSVVSLRLKSALCLPMRVDGRTLGAIFLGKKDSRLPLSDELTGQLRMLAAMAVPFLAQLRRGQSRGPTDEILGESESISSLRARIARIGPTDLSVLILGPSGSGKELVALGLHRASGRAGHSMISINCASLPEALLGAELFGYRKGAFTSAQADRKGLIEAAHCSTLFLDEVGDMPLAMQASLLRVLEGREVTRLGEHHPRPVDFRLIAATNRDLEVEVKEGRFREDLFFRLQEIALHVPALCDRDDDVVLLARTFLRQTEARLGLGSHSFSADAIDALRRHPWQGNVRELLSVIRRAAVLAERREITPHDLMLGPTKAGQNQGLELALGDLDRPLAEARDVYVQQYVQAVVARCDNRELAAKQLQIGLRSLYRYLP